MRRWAPYDVAGRRVATLFDGAVRSGAPRTLNWDGRSDTGERAASGVYFLRLETPAGAVTHKVLMAK